MLGGILGYIGKGYNNVLVISDYATRYVIACSLENQTPKTVAFGHAYDVWDE